MARDFDLREALQEYGLTDRYLSCSADEAEEIKQFLIDEIKAYLEFQLMGGEFVKREFKPGQPRRKSDELMALGWVLPW